MNGGNSKVMHLIRVLKTCVKRQKFILLCHNFIVHVTSCKKKSIFFILQACELKAFFEYLTIHQFFFLQIWVRCLFCYLLHKIQVLVRVVSRLINVREE
jgi:hypothetical protein